MKFLIQRLALTVAFVFGMFSVSQAATVNFNYSGSISAATPYLTTVNVTAPQQYTLNLTVSEGSPFFLLLNTATAVSYSGSGPAGQTLTAILNLDVGNHLFYAFTSSFQNTNISIEMAPVPLPATLPLMVGALGLGGFAIRRRQKKNQAKRSFFPEAA